MKGSVRGGSARSNCKLQTVPKAVARSTRNITAGSTASAQPSPMVPAMSASQEMALNSRSHALGSANAREDASRWRLRSAGAIRLWNTQTPNNCRAARVVDEPYDIECEIHGRLIRSWS